MTRVVDGDTIDVLIDGDTARVRIIGIDTPETVDPRKPVQCFGKEATEKLRQLLQGGLVLLTIDPVGDSVDRYSRLLRHVKSVDLATNYGAQMIRDGYAHAYLNYPFTKSLMDEYAALEREARADDRGMWAPGACDQPPEDAETLAAPISDPLNLFTDGPAVDLTNDPRDPLGIIFMSEPSATTSRPLVLGLAAVGVLGGALYLVFRRRR